MRACPGVNLRGKVVNCADGGSSRLPADVDVRGRAPFAVAEEEEEAANGPRWEERELVLDDGEGDDAGDIMSE